VGPMATCMTMMNDASVLCCTGDFGVVNSRSLDMLIDEAKRGAYDMVLHVGDRKYYTHICVSLLVGYRLMLD
jgi:molybdopterin-guanine dinucleotide biosynthesis protein A